MGIETLKNQNKLISFLSSKMKNIWTLGTRVTSKNWALRTPIKSNKKIKTHTVHAYPDQYTKQFLATKLKQRHKHPKKFAKIHKIWTKFTHPFKKPHITPKSLTNRPLHKLHFDFSPKKPPYSPLSLLRPLHNAQAALWAADLLHEGHDLLMEERNVQHLCKRRTLSVHRMRTAKNKN